ncbi:MAG: hypothetical protein P1U85_00395 [Verrucomicrobiales bacterium]|nr:hypothetical protein [Verrucomicrobiales bacterium]
MSTFSLPSRKSPYVLNRSPETGQPQIVFVTVCAFQRKHLFANESFHQALLDSWEKATDWRPGYYTILPDHLHFFASPGVSNPSSVRQWIRYWKRIVSRSLGHTADNPLWQRHAWDRLLRSSDSYAEKVAYVRNNPVRHGLIENAGDWPLQGEVYFLNWYR